MVHEKNKLSESDETICLQRYSVAFNMMLLFLVGDITDSVSLVYFSLK